MRFRFLCLLVTRFEISDIELSVLVAFGINRLPDFRYLVVGYLCKLPLVLTGYHISYI